MCSGDSASRGAFTFFEGASDKPVSSTSLSPWGRSFDERLTSSARWATATLTTKSPVASTLASVSFFDPSLQVEPGFRCPVPEGDEVRGRGEFGGEGFKDRVSLAGTAPGVAGPGRRPFASGEA